MARNKPLTVQQSFAKWWHEHGSSFVNSGEDAARVYTICEFAWHVAHRAGVRRARYEGDVRGRVKRN